MLPVLNPAPLIFPHKSTAPTAPDATTSPSPSRSHLWPFSFPRDPLPASHVPRRLRPHLCDEEKVPDEYEQRRQTQPPSPHRRGPASGYLRPHEIL